MTSTTRSSCETWYPSPRAVTVAFAVVLLPLLIATQAAPAQIFTVLHTFTGQADGAEPFGSLVQDAAGNIYGAAAYGGNTNGACASTIPPGCGVIYKLDPSGNQTILYTFTGPPDGASPGVGLIVDPVGNLYGPAGGGGNLLTCYGGCGVVFKVDPTGNETVLYSFSGGADGAGPTGALVRDAAGNLYGTTSGGGVQSGSSGFGVVYKLDPSGHETVLYAFAGGADGGYPAAGVIRDAAGNLYGTGWYGGAFNQGIVFKVDTAGKETVLYSFTGHSDGGSPFAGLVQDASGNLYGTTEGGGLILCGLAGCGVVFKLDTTGKETVLHSFSGPDGALPESAGLAMDTLGNLYGVTYIGGTATQTCPVGCGVVYKLDTSGNETVLYSFAGGADGADPSETLLLGASGNLYGTALFGGASNLGTAFQLAAPFSISTSALTPNPVSPGASATSTVRMTPSGFSGDIALTCSVQPSSPLSPKCSLSPSSIASGTTATLTVSTIGPTASIVPFDPGQRAFPAAWLPLIGLAAARVRSSSKSRKRGGISTTVVECLLFAGLIFVLSCGGGSAGGGGDSGTPPGTYTVTVTGTSSSATLTNSAVTTLRVQ